MIKFWNCKFLRNRRSGVYIVCRDRFIFLFCAQWARLQSSGGICVWVHKWFIRMIMVFMWLSIAWPNVGSGSTDSLRRHVRPPLSNCRVSQRDLKHFRDRTPPPSLCSQNVTHSWDRRDSKGKFFVFLGPWQKEWENNDETALHPDLRGWRWIVQ
jgi:hypothetical protein